MYTMPALVLQEPATRPELSPSALQREVADMALSAPAWPRSPHLSPVTQSFLQATRTCTVPQRRASWRGREDWPLVPPAAPLTS